MSGLNRVEPGTDLSSEGGRGLLQETLDLFSNAYKNLREELTKVREQDRIVAPVPIEEFPTTLGVSASSVGGAPANSIMFSAVDSVPAGYAACDGTNGTPDLQGRVPVGSGAGSGLSLRNVGNTGGAETHSLTSSELPTHSHSMSNHTHQGAAHTHPMGHVHSLSAHTHNVTAYTAGGGGTAGISYGASGGASNSVATGAPSTDSTGAASYSDTGARSASTSSGPSTNNTGNSGGNAPHNNMPPYRVLKALMKTSGGDLDLARKCPILFGRVPAVFDLEGPAAITNCTSADGYEVITTGAPPEKITTVTLSGASSAGNSVGTILTFSVYVPYNFRKWKTAAVRLRTKLSMTGCSGGSSATITLRARNPIATSGYLSGTSTRTINVSAGSIADSAWVDMTLKTTDLGDDWKPGYFLTCEVVWSIPKTFTSATLKVGRLQINW